MQSRPVTQWDADLPVALTPVWQAAQPLVILLWSTDAGFQARVEWQPSQAPVAGMCVPGLPVACTPSWQVPQVPFTTPAWSKVAGFQAVVL